MSSQCFTPAPSHGRSTPALKLASSLLVMLVNVPSLGFGVFPPETPSRRRAANRVLGEPVTGLFAGWRQRTPFRWGLRPATESGYPPDVIPT